jgi:hypothetical protein
MLQETFGKAFSSDGAGFYKNSVSVFKCEQIYYLVSRKCNRYLDNCFYEKPLYYSDQKSSCSDDVQQKPNKLLR